jgi:hypothetical protein
MPLCSVWGGIKSQHAHIYQFEVLYIDLCHCSASFMSVLCCAACVLSVFAHNIGTLCWISSIQTIPEAKTNKVISAGIHNVIIYLRTADSLSNAKIMPPHRAFSACKNLSRTNSAEATLSAFCKKTRTPVHTQSEPPVFAQKNLLILSLAPANEIINHAPIHAE